MFIRVWDGARKALKDVSVDGTSSSIEIIEDNAVMTTVEVYELGVLVSLVVPVEEGQDEETTGVFMADFDGVLGTAKGYEVITVRSGWIEFKGRRYLPGETIYIELDDMLHFKACAGTKYDCRYPKEDPRLQVDDDEDTEDDLEGPVDPHEAETVRYRVSDDGK